MMLTLISMTTAEMNKIIAPILEVCKILVPALLAVVGAVGAIFCILLGVKYARASAVRKSSIDHLKTITLVMDQSLQSILKTQVRLKTRKKKNKENGHRSISFLLS